MSKVEVIKANVNLIDRKKSTQIDKRLRVAAYCRVSTDSEDQLNSYRSQVQYYTDLISKKSEWVKVGIYADEGITGTQVNKREDFQRLINDCMRGEIDMIITKSISRFARNTVDTLNYVRKLKENNVAVFFEDENINTLSMDGELLLTVLSSVAQQEVENISSNVKKGLKMKMQRGELVGFQSCLGYDYDPTTKQISVNQEEKEIVKLIFKRYLEGVGATVIKRELESLGYKTKYGSKTWCPTTIIGILKNEKYVGDLLQGKTFTLDPISKRRLDNYGEEDQFYLKDHHEPIISREDYEAVQKILKKRAGPRRINTDGKRERFTRKYAFSCLIKCGFCGSTMTRRHWNTGKNYSKSIWHCVSATKDGKKNCPHSKGIEETIVEEAFVNAFNLIKSNDKALLEGFISKVEESLNEHNVAKKLEKIEKELSTLESKKLKLVDMHLEGVISKEDFENKYQEIILKIEDKQVQITTLKSKEETQNGIYDKIKTCRKLLQENDKLETFDRVIFESIIERVIVGGFDDKGNIDPYMITLILKTGNKVNISPVTGRGRRRKNIDEEVDDSYQLLTHDLDNSCQLDSVNACGDCNSFVPKNPRCNY